MKDPGNMVRFANNMKKIRDDYIKRAALKPGRELDALVAEKVMGLEFDNNEEQREALFVKMKESRTAYRWLVYEDWAMSTNKGICPAYSSSTSAAWEVVEHMLSKGHTFDVEGWTTNNVIEYRVHFNDVDRAYGSTVAHAICLAALRAVGYEVE